LIVPVDPNQAVRRGPKPILLRCRDHADECKRIFTITDVLLHGDVPFNDIKISLQPQDVGVLYARKLVRDNDVFKGFLKRARHPCAGHVAFRGLLFPHGGFRAVCESADCGLFEGVAVPGRVCDVGGSF